MGGKKREYTSNSNKDTVKGKKLFAKAFYKCFFSGNVFNTIKGAIRLTTLFLVVGIGVLGL